MWEAARGGESELGGVRSVSMLRDSLAQGIKGDECMHAKE